MSSAEQMRINTSMFAPMIISGGPSMWQYSSWQRLANYIDRRIEIFPKEPKTVSNWTDVTLTYTPPKTADRAGETQFMGTTSALAVASSTYVAPIDGFAFGVWQESMVVNGQNTLQILKSDDVYDDYASLLCTEERDAVAYHTKTELSLVERQTLAADGFDWWIDMPYYWTTTLDRNINLFALGLEHTITIKLQPIERCVESDGTGAVTGTLSNLRLRILYSHYSGKERDDYLTDVCTGMGLVWKIRDIQRTTFKIAAGTTGTVAYPLSAINGDVQTLVFMPRLTTDLQPTTNKITKPFNNFQKLASRLRIIGNGNEEFYPWTEIDYLLFHCHRKAGYPSPVGKRIPRVNFERYPALGPNAYSGSRYFGNINQPQVELDFTDAVPAAEITVYVKAIVVNFIQHSNGEVSRAIPTF